MKKFGIAFITVGFYLALFAFNMDVVVGKTYNIGLLDERQNIIFLSGIIFLAGIILFGFGFVAKEESKNIKMFAINCFSLPIVLLIGFMTLSELTAVIVAAIDKHTKEERLIFVDNKNGTVTHKASGLIWQKCSVGQLWSGTTCTGEAKSFTWDEAIKLKSDIAEKTDWRLPTKAELMQLVYCSDGKYNSEGSCTGSSITDPTISKTHFPNTPSLLFWSSSTYAGSNSGYAWYVAFDGGYSNYHYKNSGGNVRLVRNAQ